MKYILELIYVTIAILFAPLTMLRVLAACLVLLNRWAKSIIDKSIDRHFT